VTDWFRKAGLEQVRVPEDKPNVFNPDPMTLGISPRLSDSRQQWRPSQLKIIQSIESRTGQVLYDDGKADKEASRTTC